MNSRELMNKQLHQVFEYAELLKRLNDARGLLDVKDGYQSEREIAEKIDELTEVIKKNMKKHMSNSGVSQHAMNIINNVRYFIDED